MDALAVSIVVPESTGVKMPIVCRIVAVDISVFEDVVFRTEYFEMSDYVGDRRMAWAADYIG